MDWNVRLLTGCFFGDFQRRIAQVRVHSRPKVLVSSTAVSIFSYSMEKEGYGGRSRRLKHV